MSWYKGRRTWYGYVDMGPIQIPLLPVNIILTDRDDGSQWLLEYNASSPNADGAGYVGITSVLPNPRVPSVTYPAGEEPYFGNDFGQVTRLIVRGGSLGVDVQSPDRATDHENAILGARNGLNPTFAQLIFSISIPGQYAFQLVTA